MEVVLFCQEGWTVGFGSSGFCLGFCLARLAAWDFDAASSFVATGAQDSVLTVLLKVQVIL